MQHSPETIFYVILKTAAHRACRGPHRKTRRSACRGDRYTTELVSVFEDLAVHPVRSTAPSCAHVGPSTPLLIGHSNRKYPPALYSRQFSGNLLELQLPQPD